MTRDLTPFFAPRSIAVVGAGERATSSGGAIMQLLRQAGYGGRVVPVNPKGGTIFGYQSVTSIAAVDPRQPHGQIEIAEVCFRSTFLAAAALLKLFKLVPRQPVLLLLFWRTCGGSAPRGRRCPSVSACR